MYDEDDARTERRMNRLGERLAAVKAANGYHQFYLEQKAMADAQADFAAACERTVKPGRCTGCEEDADELLPWASHERLCWRCTDYQLDLLAIALGEMWADAGAGAAA